jgi:subfamily B ATP-binding cassette protein MsbA
MSVYKKYASYLFKHKVSLFSGIFLSLLSAAFAITPIYIIEYVVKSAFEEKNVSMLFKAIILGLASIMGIFLLTFLSRFTMEFLSKKIIYQMRGKIFKSLMYLPLRFYKNTKTGNIISTSTNDIYELQYFTATGIMNLIKEPVVIVLALYKMLSLNFMLSLFIFALAPVFVLIIHFLSKKVKAIETRIRAKLANLTSMLQEAIYGVEVVKVFAMEKTEIDKFNNENRGYLNEDKKLMKYINLARPMVDFIGGLGVLFLLSYGGYKVIKGEITTSELTALIVALTTISLPVKNLSETFIQIKKASASLLRIFSLMEEEPEEYAGNAIPSKERLSGDIVFDKVSFSYDDANVLDEVSFEIKKGQVAAFVGYSGAGKTTLVNLVPKLIKPSSGNLLIDGEDVNSINLTYLRRNISVVTQENIIFNATVAENISYAKPDATKEEILHAAKVSNCLEFIEKMPEGFNTHVGDRGLKLSGGQCQRITLARAVLRNPSILILDEATSSLDSESEKLIQQALAKIIRNQTTLIISHRLSTIFNADIIYVLDKGKIVQKGTHDELLKKGGIYKKLYDLQFEI